MPPINVTEFINTTKIGIIDNFAHILDHFGIFLEYYTNIIKNE